MTKEIDGSAPSPITPREVKMYEEEYKRGAKLFQDALEAYKGSDNPYQQAEFQKVMDQAMNVLNEAAQGLNRKALMEQNSKIEKDYSAFNDTPKDSRTLSELSGDLERAKKSV